MAVMNTKSEANELWHNSRASGPNINDLFTARFPCFLRFFEKITIYKRTFPDRTRHNPS